VKEGVALAPPLAEALASSSGSGGKSKQESGDRADSSDPSVESCTALVPPPPLPKGLELQFADPVLAATAAATGAATSSSAAPSDAESIKRAARPYVRVESAEACCALCAATPGCTSFTHGAVVLAPGASGGAEGGGDAAPDRVRTSCELWAEGSGGSSKPPANGEYGLRGTSDAAKPSQLLESVPAPAWVTSGRVPRAAESGAAAATASGAKASSSPASSSSHRLPSVSKIGGGLYGGAFDTHVGDYQGSAIKQAHNASETPCARASDAVKAGGAGALALFDALHPGKGFAPTTEEAVMSEDEYKAAAAALLGPAAATEQALEERFYAQRGRGLLAEAADGAAAGGGGARQPRRPRTPQQQDQQQQPQDQPTSDPCGASLALMTSTWLAGGTLLPAGGSDGASVGTVRACCQLCAATGGCQYWTFSTPLSSCWLRSGSGASIGYASVDGAVASQPAGGGPLSSVPCRYSISGAMAGAPSPGLCPAALVCRGAPSGAMPDGAASCCPAVGWQCSDAGVCCPPGSNPCGAQCGCPMGQSCLGGSCVAAQQVAAVPMAPAAAPAGAQVQFSSQQQTPRAPNSAQYVQAQQPAWQSQLLQFQGQQPGQPGGNPSGGSGLIFGPGGGTATTTTFSADAPRFGYYGRAVVDGAALVTDPSDPQACRQRPAEGAAAFRFGRIVASNSGGALNRNAPVAQATAVDCCLACGGIGNCDAFSWDSSSMACHFWTNKINGVTQQRLETPQKGAVTGDMIRSLSFRADGTPVPRLDDACRAPCGPTDGSRPSLCCVEGRETCLAPAGVGFGGDRHQCCANASVCGRRCGCDPGSICVGQETCCPGERVCGSLCCPQGQVCDQNGACGAPRQDQGGIVIANPQWGWNRGAWWNGGGWNGGWNGGVIPISTGGRNVFEG
jgi:hypothetical protein